MCFGDFKRTNLFVKVFLFFTLRFDAWLFCSCVLLLLVFILLISIGSCLISLIVLLVSLGHGARSVDTLGALGRLLSFSVLDGGLLSSSRLLVYVVCVGHYYYCFVLSI